VPEFISDPVLWAVNLTIGTIVAFTANKIRVVANAGIKFFRESGGALSAIQAQGTELWDIHTVQDDTSHFQVRTVLHSLAEIAGLLRQLIKFQKANMKLLLMLSSDPEHSLDVQRIQAELNEGLMGE
jgi:hypothetical protein